MIINLPGAKWKVLLLCLVFLGGLGATPDRTVYSKTSNKELKEKAAQLVKSIRGLVDAYHENDRKLLADYQRKDRPEISKAAAQTLRQQWLKESDAAHETTLREFRDRYRADALLLIDELTRRLPKRAKQSEILKLYQQPTNVLGIAAIADHLELSSKALPDT